jgi:tripartite-type tricarboxylate transporter receptor subunit TctC
VAHWRGIVAPKGRAAEVSARLIAGLRRIADDPEFQREAADSAFTVRWRFGAEFASYMDEDDRQFGRVIRLLEEGASSCAH